MSTFFALEVAVSVAPLLVFRWLDRLLRRFIHVAASAAHLLSPMSTSLYPLVALQSPFAQSHSITHSRRFTHYLTDLIYFLVHPSMCVCCACFVYFVVGVVGTVCECVMCGWVVHGHVWSVSYVPHAESGLRVCHVACVMCVV